MSFDELVIEPGQKRVYYSCMNVEIYLHGEPIAGKTITLQARGPSQLKALRATLPREIKSEYEDSRGISVRTRKCYGGCMTKRKLLELREADARDTERQIDKWML